MRRSLQLLALPFVLAATLALTACGDAPPASPPASPAPAEKAADSKESLTALVEVWKKAHAAKDDAALQKLAFAIIPTTADLRALLKEGAETEDFLPKFTAKDLKADDPTVKSLEGGMFKPSSAEQKDVAVHVATTEELLANEPSTAAFKEFPGGMKRFAALSKPKLLWYVVELLEPGQNEGKKFTCFANVGGRWIFLATPWRALGREEK